MVDYFPEILFIDAVDLHGVGFVDQVEQGGESVAQADAATASVTDVVDALELIIQGGFVVKSRIVLSERMTGRGFETAFTGCG